MRSTFHLQGLSQTSVPDFKLGVWLWELHNLISDFAILYLHVLGRRLLPCSWVGWTRNFGSVST